MMPGYLAAIVAAVVVGAALAIIVFLGRWL